MTNFEMVEKLRAKTNVTYEEAKAALEASNWDLLDAMVLLEQEGRVNKNENGEYSTKQKAEDAGDTRNHRFGQTLGRVGRRLAAVLTMGNNNTLEISRKDETLLSLPVTVVALLLIFMFWVALPLLVIGLFTGFRYSFKGPDLGREAINRTMNKASDIADNLKQDIQKGEKED